MILDDARFGALADERKFHVLRNAQAERRAQATCKWRKRQDLEIAWQTRHLPYRFELAVLSRMHRHQTRRKWYLSSRLSLRHQEGRSLAPANFT